MSRRIPTPLLYTLLQLVSLALVILYLSWHYSSTPRSPYAQPEFRYVLTVLLYFAIPCKGAGMFGGFLLVRCKFWRNNNRLARAILIYLVDLACTAFSLWLLLPFIIGSLFIDADFPISMALFPHVLLIGILVAILEPASEATSGQSSYSQKHRLPWLMPATAAVLALILGATIIVERSASLYTLVSMTLFSYPVMLFFSWVYLLPAFITTHRSPAQTNLMLLINLASGWTLIGWLACMVWSLVTNAGIDRIPWRINWRIVGACLIALPGLVLIGLGISLLEDNHYAFPAWLLNITGLSLLYLSARKLTPINLTESKVSFIQ